MITTNLINKSKRHLTVGDLKRGDLFIYDDILYILVESRGCYANVECTANEFELFGLNLKTGEIEGFGVDDCISKVPDIEINIDKGELQEWIS
jgi:hypothetical protein